MQVWQSLRLNFKRSGVNQPHVHSPFFSLDHFPTPLLMRSTTNNGSLSYDLTWNQTPDLLAACQKLYRLTMQSVLIVCKNYSYATIVKSPAFTILPTGSTINELYMNMQFQNHEQFICGSHPKFIFLCCIFCQLLYVL